MKNMVAMDERSRLRQFWLRVLLSLGILWGTVPLITVPFVFRGANDSTFDVLAALCNGLTILPACILAFWHRRMACIWLTVNGAMLAIAVASSARRIHEYDLGAIIGIVVPVLIAICLGFLEARHWPGALD
ncbi:MAG: hypothetical protein QOH35_2684 [Acidobacteriaceae bacterium]|jgi:hypothetical protein|nr:hypothetical protein [Acidobacteriaceae bacterium]